MTTIDFITQLFCCVDDKLTQHTQKHSQANLYPSEVCTAIGNLDHCLNQDCDTMTIRLKGDSDGKTKKIHRPI